VSRRCTQAQDHGLERALGYQLIELAKPAFETKQAVRESLPIQNVHRSVGAMISGELVRRHGPKGLPDDTIHFDFTGSAGQSFGAFLASGITLSLEGEANDYVGKGLQWMHPCL
jgi:glutamate synthase domain-containing protein 3